MTPIPQLGELLKLESIQHLTDQAEWFTKKDEIIEIFDLETKNLNEIIEKSPFKNDQIDLLNIDTEGNDFSVLTSLDMNKYKPNIIIIESHLKTINEIIIFFLFSQ